MMKIKTSNGNAYQARRRIIKARVSPLRGPRSSRGARIRCSEYSILDEPGLEALRQANSLINGGKAFRMPSKISSIDQAIGYGREKIAAALGELKAGARMAATKSLLEVIMMVITPMPAH